MMSMSTEAVFKFAPAFTWRKAQLLLHQDIICIWSQM